MSDESPIHDEYGTPRVKMPNCPACEEDELGASFVKVWCHRCSFVGVLVAPGVVEASPAT